MVRLAENISSSDGQKTPRSTRHVSVAVCGNRDSASGEIETMHAVTRRIVFESNGFRIGHVVARPASLECGEVECQNENVLVLPLTGVFAKHDGPRRHVVVTPN